MKSLTQKVALLLICTQLALPSHGLSLLGIARAEEITTKTEEKMPEAVTPGVNETMVAGRNEALKVSEELSSLYFCPVKPPVRPKTENPVNLLDDAHRKWYDDLINKSNYYQNKKDGVKRKTDLALRLLHHQAHENKDKPLKAWLKKYQKNKR